MLPHEKKALRQEFNENKHHLVSAMNIMLYLTRWQILKIDSEGKKFEWNESNA
jgi:hypothetical protein